MSVNDFETDEQRAEALLDWIKRNGGFIVLLVVVGFGTIFGTHYYKESKEKSKLADSAVYSKFLNKYAQGDEITSADFEQVVAQSNSAYASLASLAVAKQKAENGKLDEAESYLISALEGKIDDSLAALLQYRLALVYFDQDKLDDALSTLQNINDQGFKGVVKSLEGDIYVLQNKIDMAKIAYEEALNTNPALRYTALKLTHIGG